jgi:hypothetical protein
MLVAARPGIEGGKDLIAERPSMGHQASADRLMIAVGKDVTHHSELEQPLQMSQRVTCPY